MKRDLHIPKETPTRPTHFQDNRIVHLKKNVCSPLSKPTSPRVVFIAQLWVFFLFFLGHICTTRLSWKCVGLVGVSWAHMHDTCTIVHNAWHIRGIYRCFFFFSWAQEKKVYRCFFLGTYARQMCPRKNTYKYHARRRSFKKRPVDSGKETSKRDLWTF